MNARSSGKINKNAAPKFSTTRQESKVEFDNALKESKEKKNKIRPVKSRLVDEEDVPPTDVVEVDDEDIVKDTSPLVRKNSKKNIALKGKNPVSEKEIVRDVADEVEKEERVQKEKVEKKNPLRKRQSTSKEPCSSKRVKVELSELEKRANLKKNVLWDRVFDPEIIE